MILRSEAHHQEQYLQLTQLQLIVPTKTRTVNGLRTQTGLALQYGRKPQRMRSRVTLKATMLSSTDQCVPVKLTKKQTVKAFLSRIGKSMSIILERVLPEQRLERLKGIASLIVAIIRPEIRPPNQALRGLILNRTSNGGQRRKA